MRKWVIGIAVVVAVAISTEMLLRAAGFQRYPVFVTDKRYEYMTAPDQDLRLGNIRYATNELGMRCGPIGKKKGKRVLLIGDSVINGMYKVTQDALATSTAERELTDRLGIPVQVLNASASSWGASNAAAFLKAHGTFDTDLIIAVFSSHDAFDRMIFEPLVGHHPSYPDRQPLVAWEMFLEKIAYQLGAYEPPEKPRLFDDGWRQLRDLSRDQGVPFVVLLHPEIGELRAGRYDRRGAMLLDSLHAWKVPVREMLLDLSSEFYYDDIHLNNAGQQRLSEVIVAEAADRIAP